MQAGNMFTQQHRTPTLKNTDSNPLSGIAAHLTFEADFFRRQLVEAFRINSSLLHMSGSFSAVAQLQPSDQKGQASKVTSSPSDHSGAVKEQENEESLEESRRKYFIQTKLRKSSKRRNDLDGASDDNDKNETKNIPKNYGKAMLSFVQRHIFKHIHKITPILDEAGLTIQDLLREVKTHKRRVNSINYLKLIWGHNNQKDPILRCIRILSYLFMRKHCLEYIFNSRVKNFGTHVKYRKRIMEGIQNSEEFTSIKQY